jgi:hypothetical protein
MNLMPKSRVARKRMYRDFSKLNPRYIASNYLKYCRKIRREFCKKHDLRESEVEFMLWAYDLEFFTIDHAGKDNDITKRHAGEELIYPLKNKGMLYKQFDKLSGKDTLEQEMFKKETKFSYRVRYALTQQARLLVQRYYNLLEESLR